MNTTTTTYADAIHAAADDVIRQLEDGESPPRRCPTLAAGGYYFEAVRVFFADVTADHEHGIPAGVARIALDMTPHRRRPAHEVRILLEDPTTNDAAHDLAAAVLDMIDSTADYAR